VPLASLQNSVNAKDTINTDMQQYVHYSRPIYLSSEEASQMTDEHKRRQWPTD